MNRIALRCPAPHGSGAVAGCGTQPPPMRTRNHAAGAAGCPTSPLPDQQHHVGDRGGGADGQRAGTGEEVVADELRAGGGGAVGAGGQRGPRIGLEDVADGERGAALVRGNFHFSERAAGTVDLERVLFDRVGGGVILLSQVSYIYF